MKPGRQKILKNSQGVRNHCPEVTQRRKANRLLRTSQADGGWLLCLIRPLCNDYHRPANRTSAENYSRAGYVYAFTPGIGVGTLGSEITDR